jgi:3-oxoacyl-[acyl-carrier protein] reductase
LVSKTKYTLDHIQNNGNFFSNKIIASTMNINLQNKTAVVCGSSQGIGLAAAKVLSQLGATCILLARNQQVLEQALLELDTSANQVHQIAVADFDDSDAVAAAIQNIVANTTVHILINNSGGPKSGAIATAAAEEFTTGFSRHVICNHILTKAVVPGMKEAGYGRIINIISTSVKIPLPNLGVSNTIRGAVASWAKTMANELGQHQITVNNVLPGYTDTQRLQSLIAGIAASKQAEPTQVAEEMKKDIPMKRFGIAEEIANMIAFLASPAASYVNGTSIRVDGGRTGSI